MKPEARRPTDEWTRGEAEDRCFLDYLELHDDQMDPVATRFGRVVERAVERAMRS